jgi:hypothetical protein
MIIIIIIIMIMIIIIIPIRQQLPHMLGCFIQRVALCLELLRQTPALARQLLLLSGKLRALLSEPLTEGRSNNDKIWAGMCDGDVVT